MGATRSYALVQILQALTNLCHVCLEAGCAKRDLAAIICEALTEAGLACPVCAKRPHRAIDPGATAKKEAGKAPSTWGVLAIEGTKGTDDRGA